MKCYFKVAEQFVSINGEGTRAGELAVFIRLCGCNLHCSYCDTQWANQPDAVYTLQTAEEILHFIQKTGIRNITLTGGEPLLANKTTFYSDSAVELIQTLISDTTLSLEIETNGSVMLEPFAKLKPRPIFTMDYKLPSSGMESKMQENNFDVLQKQDTVKFVVGSQEDLERAYEIIQQYELIERCHVYLSPVYGAIHPQEIVSFMEQKKLNGVRVQLQLHKYIWDPQTRGV